MAEVTGIVLAAGAGSRAGGPKALRRSPDGEPWVAHSARVLLEAGCARVVIVLGAHAAQAHDLVPVDARISCLVATQWRRGLSESLRVGLAAATGDAALITLVDLPGMSAPVAGRVLAAGVLAQAVFAGRPGHPVLIPADHWIGVAETVEGDHGARPYLVEHGAREVECGDLWDGTDRDED